MINRIESKKKEGWIEKEKERKNEGKREREKVKK
jgi:hypothetical protein